MIALTMFAVVGTVLVIAAHHLSVTGRFNMNRLEVSVALIPVAVVCGICSLVIKDNGNTTAPVSITAAERVSQHKVVLGKLSNLQRDARNARIVAKYTQGTMINKLSHELSKPLRTLKSAESMVGIANARLTRAIEDEARVYQRESVKLQRRNRAVRSLNSSKAEFIRLSSKSPTRYESSGKVTTVIANN